MAMSPDERLLNALTIQKIRGAVQTGAGTPLSAQATTTIEHGVAPGRKVFDTVTGAVVEVISSTTVHIPLDAIPR